MIQSLSLAAGQGRGLLCALLLLFGLSSAQSQSGAVNISYLEGQNPVAPDAVTAWGPELFGDKVNLFNGALEFEHTDTALPGNSALPVALTRRYAPGRSGLVRGQFGDWDLEAPRVGGSFSTLQGWVTSSGGTNRCSGFSLPPVVSSSSGGISNGAGTDAAAAPEAALPPERLAKDNGAPLVSGTVGFIASDYWQGTNLSVPGQGSQEVLRRSLAYTKAPADGRSYPLVTRGNWQIGCLTNVQNAAGEGFFAVSPEGFRYRFDWMASRWQTSVKKSGAEIARKDYFLMATEVTDRFGKWVRYTYDASDPLLLQRIESSDGRVITVTNVGGRAVAVSDGTRTFSYSYDALGNLAAVQLPDGGRWSFDLSSLTTTNLSDMGEGANCDQPGALPPDELVGTMTHPSGASGRFSMQFTYFGRTYVDRYCKYAPNSMLFTTGAVYPRWVSSQALMAKSITGPGMPDMNWSYTYGGPFGWSPCVGCADRRTVKVTDPGGAITQHQFGIRWRVNEGQLLQVDEGWTGSGWLKSTTHRYRTAEGQDFPEQFGESLLRNSDYLATRNRPQDERVTTQQGVTFTWQAHTQAIGFDGLARPQLASQFSSLGYTRSEVTEYYDNGSLWVLGQKQRVAELTTNQEVERHIFEDATALKSASFSFGRPTHRFAYRADGTLQTLYDAADRPIQFQDFMRGKPQRAIFADGSVASRVISNLGQVESQTNEAGTTTSYTFDAMGRVASINYPGGDPVAYLPTLQSFTQVPADEYGLPPGHWRQTVSTGNGYRHRYFDGLWRVRLEHRFDAADVGATSSFVETRYDADNRKAFESYPSRGFAWVNQQVLPGKATRYDGLDRVVQQRADSELGPLITTTDYLGGFQRRVTNPRGHATQFGFQAFDSPSEDHIAQIWAPEGVSVAIPRDVWGKPTAITRSGPYAGATQSVTRRYSYDVFQRLCKTVEPESGSTVQQYDAAGNVAWRASGQNLPGPGCDQDAVAPNQRINFGYDARDRLNLTSHGDGSSVITRNHTADGLLSDITASRLGVNTIGWIYGYNNRRLLTSEQYNWGDPNYYWSFRHEVDALGHVSTIQDPWGPMAYEPNALGQATRVGPYASSVRYHPNGAVEGYTLGNGRAHSVGLNVRGLPHVWAHAGVTRDVYAYDANGNVASISDEQEGAHRSMPWYDGLDRLRQANGPWGAGSFSYDALDNLVSSSVGGRGLQHTIDPATNRLTGLSGSQNISIGYDANGNVVNRGGQGFSFDLGNRLITAHGKSFYAYDGHGRRNLNWYADGTYRHDAYTQDGKLRFSWKLGQNGKRFVYLGDKLIAEVAEGGITTYSHTDALGSPVAKTDSTGAVIERTRYEPYGATVAGSTNPKGIGFTGHVNDLETGLVYMQQRFYEPIAGRFLSVDPVTTEADSGGHFNQYNYANNNPFGFVDPDGRAPDCGYWSCKIVEYKDVVRAFSETVDRTITGGEGLKFSAALAEGDVPRAGLHLVAGVSYGLLTAASPIAGRLGPLAAKGIATEGKTVLGHFPEYKQLGESLSARTFNVPEAVWNKMPEAERWGANQKFLDRMISRGDQVILSTPLDKVRPGSYFARELEYLGSKGHVPSADGTRLIKP